MVLITKELKKRGLKTDESKKFLKFWNIVQEEAKNNQSLFFLSSGEGRELYFDDIEGEDLCGWLIPNEKVENFEKKWKNGNDLIEWNDFVCFAVWKKINNSIKISFKKY